MRKNARCIYYTKLRSTPLLPIGMICGTVERQVHHSGAPLKAPSLCFPENCSRARKHILHNAAAYSAKSRHAFRHNPSNPTRPTFLAICKERHRNNKFNNDDTKFVGEAKVRRTGTEKQVNTCRAAGISTQLYNSFLFVRVDNTPSVYTSHAV